MAQIPASPWMTDPEVKLFSKWLPFGCTALEFGSGGSTRFFFENGAKQLSSVEGDGNWIESLVADPFLAFFLGKGRLKIHMPDIGPIRENSCSNPAGDVSPKWLNYHNEIWELIDCSALNFILIDGRFRLACALQSIVYCEQKPLLLFHDFWNRPVYHPILEFVDVLDRAETSAVLRQKDVVDWRKLTVCLQRAQFDPS